MLQIISEIHPQHGGNLAVASEMIRQSAINGRSERAVPRTERHRGVNPEGSANRERESWTTRYR